MTQARALFRFVPRIVEMGLPLDPAVLGMLEERDRQIEDHLSSVSSASLVTESVPYTPAWSGTVGNGTATGSYVLVGNIVFFQLAITWGTTTSHGVGSQKFGLPITPKINASGIYPPIGFAHLGNAGIADFFRFAVYEQTFGVVQCWTEGGVVVTATAPFTFGVGDDVTIQGTYEID